MNWLNGKKTYIAAMALAALGIWLVLRGFVEMGMYCIMTAAGFVGLGDRANRHQAQVLTAIGDLGQVIAAAKGKQPELALDEVFKVIGDALAVNDKPAPNPSAGQSAVGSATAPTPGVEWKPGVPSFPGGPVNFVQGGVIKSDGGVIDHHCEGFPPPPVPGQESH